MSEVVKFPGITTLSRSPENVIREAAEAGMTDVMVIGYDADGDFYFNSSSADGGEVLWLLEYAKRRLFEAAEEMECR